MFAASTFELTRRSQQHQTRHRDTSEERGGHLQICEYTSTVVAMLTEQLDLPYLKVSRVTMTRNVRLTLSPSSDRSRITRTSPRIPSGYRRRSQRPTRMCNSRQTQLDACCARSAMSTWTVTPKLPYREISDQGERLACDGKKRCTGRVCECVTGVAEQRSITQSIFGKNRPWDKRERVQKINRPIHPTFISSSLHHHPLPTPSPYILVKMTGVLNGNGPSAELAPGQ